MKNIRLFFALCLVSVIIVSNVQADEVALDKQDRLQATDVFAELTEAPNNNDKPIVWFVHGIKCLRTEFHKERRALLKIYPNAEDANGKGVPIIKWDSPRLMSKSDWKSAVIRADKYSLVLAERIKKMTPADQKRLILAGHSLGGHIVVRTAAILHKDNIKIKKIILAGAAIDNDDEDIASTWEVSDEPVVNLVNTQDIALAFYCWLGEKHAALGTGYKNNYPEGRFYEIPVHKSISHSKYFNVYKDILYCFDINNITYIVVPQVRPNLNWKTMNRHTWWDIVDECHGWELQKNIGTSRYRIVDNENVRRAWGHLADKNDVIEVFEIVKGRLVKQYGPSPMPGKWWLLMNPKQDEFTIHSKKNDKSSRWETLEEYMGWKLQITKKSIGKGPLKIDEQKAKIYRLKRDAFNKAKIEYFTKIYEYKFFKKRWSRILDKAYYARLDDGFNEQFENDLKEELDENFEEDLDKDIEEELSDDDDEEMDSKQKKEMIKELKNELDEELNSEVDKELTKEYWEKYSDRIEQLKNGLDKKQVKELLKQLDVESDKDVDDLKKDFNDRKDQLRDQRKNGELTKKEYKELYKNLKEKRKDKKNRLEKEHDDKEEQLKNQSFKNQYKKLYNELKEDYKTQKKLLKNEIKDLKDKYKQAEKEYKKVKKYDETECRILDPENRRRAKGNQTNLKESFEDVKKQIDDLFTRYNN